MHHVLTGIDLLDTLICGVVIVTLIALMFVYCAYFLAMDQPQRFAAVLASIKAFLKRD